MKLQEIYSHLYFHELERKDKLNNGIAIPVGIVSLIFGAVSLLAKEIDKPYIGIIYAQLVCLGITLISLVFAIIFLCQMSWGYKYLYIPTADDLRSHNKNLFEYYLKTNKTNDEAKEISELETIDYLYNQYSSNSNQNCKNNDKKSNNLFYANTAIIIAIVFLVISTIPFVLKTIENPSQPQKVEITNLKELNMSLNKATSQPTPPPAPPVKPEPPPSRAIRENVEKPTR